MPCQVQPRTARGENTEHPGRMYHGTLPPPSQAPNCRFYQSRRQHQPKGTPPLSGPLGPSPDGVECERAPAGKGASFPAFRRHCPSHPVLPGTAALGRGSLLGLDGRRKHGSARYGGRPIRPLWRSAPFPRARTAFSWPPAYSYPMGSQPRPCHWPIGSRKPLGDRFPTGSASSDWPGMAGERGRIPPSGHMGVFGRSR